MSQTMKRNLAGGSVLTLLVSAAVLLLLGNPFASGESTPPREIVLEARDLAFDGDNPTLEATPGERLRLVVRNTDPGVLHSFSLPGLDSRVYHVAYGEEVAIDLVAPAAGTYEYTCPQHAPKMRGKLVVQARH